MLALKIIGGTFLFVLPFILLGQLVGNTAEKSHTLIAFLLLYLGIAVLCAVILLYGRAVR